MFNSKKNGGFLLMEALVGMALVAIAAAGMGRILHHSMRSSKASALRFNYQMLSTAWRDRLLSVSFQHPWVQEGDHLYQEGKVTCSWRVTALSPELKRIALIVQEGEWKADCRFIKSLYLHDGKDDAESITTESRGGES